LQQQTGRSALLALLPADKGTAIEMKKKMKEKKMTRPGEEAQAWCG
jgi:hypothetical protein